MSNSTYTVLDIRDINQKVPAFGDFSNLSISFDGFKQLSSSLATQQTIKDYGLSSFSKLSSDIRTNIDYNNIIKKSSRLSDFNNLCTDIRTNIDYNNIIKKSSRLSDFNSLSNDISDKFGSQWGGGGSGSETTTVTMKVWSSN